MEKREEVIKLWFDLWLQKADLGILDIFADNALYIESWGPKYKGSEKIKHWFDEWNTRGTVFQREKGMKAIPDLAWTLKVLIQQRADFG